MLREKTYLIHVGVGERSRTLEITPSELDTLHLFFNPEFNAKREARCYYRGLLLGISLASSIIALILQLLM